MPSIINATTVSGVAITGDNSGNLALQTNNGNTAVTIDTSQNVGIGTSTITSSAGWTPKLVLSGTSAAAIVKGINSQEVSVGSSDGMYFDCLGATTGSNNNFIFRNSSSNSSFSASERMRITSSGEVLIGRTSSLNSESFAIRGVAGDANNYLMTMQSQATSVAVTMIAFYDGAGTFCGQVYIDTSANTTYYSTSSDYRLKENVAPMAGALAKVQQLNPVTYNWKKSGKKGQGFIAHELKEVVPECVIGEKDAVDKDGNIMPQMVDTSFLVATLTAAIQELNAKVEAQAVRIAELEGVK
jgi:hypothetical protein